MNIFLGLPISTPLFQENISFKNDYFRLIKKIINRLRSGNVNKVFCALEFEKWGEELSGPEDAVRKDFIEIEKADISIFLIPQKFLSSLYIEIGWATSKNKKCFVYHHISVDPIYLLKGMAETKSIVLNGYNNHSDLLKKISRLIK